jgi:hypothetical protein
MKAIIMLPPPESSPQIAYKYTRLPFMQRTVAQLFYYERLTLDEIAHVLEVSEPEVAALFYFAHVNVGVCAALGEMGLQEAIGESCPICAAIKT